MRTSNHSIDVHKSIPLLSFAIAAKRYTQANPALRYGIVSTSPSFKLCPLRNDPRGPIQRKADPASSHVAPLSTSYGASSQLYTSVDIVTMMSPSHDGKAIAKRPHASATAAAGNDFAYTAIGSPIRRC